MADPEVSVVAKLQDQFSQPLDRLSDGFGKLQDRLSDLGDGLDSVFSRVTAVLGGVTALAAVERSIDLAEEAVEAEQRLLTALDGRKKSMQDILDLASRLQATTEQEDDTLIRQAALMKRLGVSAELIPRALEASVNTAAALGAQVETVVKEISLLARGEGRGFGGRTLKLIPGIRELIDSGGGLKEIIDLLENRFPDAAAEVANTDFGRATQALNALGDSGERIGKVFIKLKLEAFQQLVPIVEKLADVAESQQFVNAVEIAKKAVPIVVALAVAATGLVAAISAVGTAGILLSFLSSLISVLTALGPAIAAVILFLADVAVVAAPALAVFAAIGVVAAALTLIILQVTGLLDDFLGGVTAARDDITGLAKEVASVAGKVLAGRLEVKDFFDYLQTRATQGRTFLIGVAESARTAVTGVVDFFTARIKGGFLSVQLALLSTADAMQTASLQVVRVIVTQVQDAINAVNSGLRVIDDALGTELAFQPIDIASLVPDEIIPIRDQVKELSSEIDDLLQRAPRSLRDIAGQAAAVMQQTLAAIITQGQALDARLAESERAILQRKAESDAEELRLQRRKTDASLAEVERLTDSTSRILANTSLLTVGDIIDEQQIRDVIQSVGESSREELSRQIEQDLASLFGEGALAAEEFVRLTQVARTASLEQQSRQIDEQLAEQREIESSSASMLTILGDQIAGYDDIIERLTGVKGQEQALIDALAARTELEDRRSEAAGAQLEATTAIVDLERERQQLLLQARAVESQLAKLREDTADKAAKEVDRQRQELLKEGKSIADLVSAGITAPAAALRAVQSRVDEFQRSVAQARDTVTSLLQAGVLGPQLGRALREALTALAASEQVSIPLAIELQSASVDAAKLKFASLRQEVDDLDVTSQFDAAVAAVTTGIEGVRETLQATREELIRLSDTPGLTDEQLATILKQVGEIDVELRSLGDGAQLDLARRIEAAVRLARETADREIELLNRDVERGLALPSDVVARQQQLAEQLTATADSAAAALRSMAAASPEVAAAIDEINRRLERLKQDVQPKSLGGGEEFFGSIGTGIQDTIARMGDLSRAGQSLGQDLVGGLTDGVVDVWIRGRQSLGEFTRQFIAEMAIMTAKALLFRAIAGAIGLSPSPTAAGANAGGVMPGGWPADDTAAFRRQYPGARRYSSGTTAVPGPRVNRDVVPALLTPGEAVITAQSVDYYGRGLMSALINRAIPREALLALIGGQAASLPAVVKGRFAEGGIAATGAVDRRRPAPSRPLVVADEQVMDRLVNGGEGVLTRFVKENR